MTKHRRIKEVEFILVTQHSTSQVTVAGDTTGFRVDQGSLSSVAHRGNMHFVPGIAGDSPSQDC